MNGNDGENSLRVDQRTTVIYSKDNNFSEIAVIYTWISILHLPLVLKKYNSLSAEDINSWTGTIEDTDMAHLCTTTKENSFGYRNMIHDMRGDVGVIFGCRTSTLVIRNRENSIQHRRLDC